MFSVERREECFAGEGGLTTLVSEHLLHSETGKWLWHVWVYACEHTRECGGRSLELQTISEREQPEYGLLGLDGQARRLPDE